jgi:hypothetical protein
VGGGSFQNQQGYFKKYFIGILAQVKKDGELIIKLAGEKK